MSRAPHEHLTDNELSNLMNDVDESLGGTAQEYRATAVRGKSHYAELRAAFDQLVKLRKAHDFAKQARVQTELRETLIAQRDQLARDVDACNRVNAESLATIERLQNRWRIAQVFVSASVETHDGALQRETYGGLLGFVRTTLWPCIDSLRELVATFTDGEIDNQLREWGGSPTAISERGAETIRALLTRPGSKQGHTIDSRKGRPIPQLAAAGGPDGESLDPSAGEPSGAEPDDYVKLLHAERVREGRLSATMDLVDIEGLVEARRCVDRHCTSVDRDDRHHAKALRVLDRLLGGAPPK